jgi:iron-sulfur cluster assembly protein
MNLELPLNISEKAYSEIESNINTKAIPEGYHLRLGLKGASCGASFIIGFDKIADTDLVFNYKKINILVDKKHLMYLAGKEVDFDVSENGTGFTFSNIENH